MSEIKIRTFKGALATLTAVAFLAFTPAKAEAFSLKRLLNPFKVSVSSVLHPFHIGYLFGKVTGTNPVAFVPGDALLYSERRWVRDPKTNDWTKYSWELEDTVQPAPLFPNPNDLVRPPSVIPPAPVVVAPPCQRGGAGITPC